MATSRKNAFKEHLRKAAAAAAQVIEEPDIVEDRPPEVQVEPTKPEPVIVKQEAEPEVVYAPAPPAPVVAEPVIVVSSAKPTRFITSADPAESSCASLGATAVLLLQYLIENESRHINVSRVALYRGDGSLIPYPTVRNAWNRILELGFIEHKRVYSQGVKKGIHYVLNEFMVATFLRIHGNGSESSLQCIAAPEAPKPVMQQQAPVVESQPAPASRLLIDTHSEFAVWRNAGVTGRNQARWEEEFGIEHELMDTYMRWCAWDVAHRSETINSISNYFYKSLKNSGGYARPEGYVSVEERRLIEMEKERAHRQELRKREEALLAEEADSALQNYLEVLLEKRSEDPLYEELKGTLSPFVRTHDMPGSPMYMVFKKGMHEALKKKVAGTL